MTRQWFAIPAMERLCVQRAIDCSASRFAHSVHWNPCLGLQPILIESPLHYFGVQILAGLGSLLALLLIEVFR